MKTLLIILVVQGINLALFAIFHRQLMVSNLALRHQLAVCRSRVKRVRLRNRDRLLWVMLSRLLKDWRSVLVIVRPETVIRWQQRRLRDYWRKKSAGKLGRPKIPRLHINFIKRISSDHPEYGEDRITLELKIKFGVENSPATVRKYMVKEPGTPRDSQTWSTFLKNHATGIWACDFLVVYTIGFRIMYVFVIIELESRKVVQFNVTEHPTLEWTKQQIRNVCFEEQPRFLLHDNDAKYGQFGGRKEVLGVYGSTEKKVSCRSALDAWLELVLGIKGLPTPYGAPNANAFWNDSLALCAENVWTRSSSSANAICVRSLLNTSTGTTGGGFIRGSMQFPHLTRRSPIGRDRTRASW